jgi:uncharacterized SAM-binding protein YcdF (DUF218 family)
LTPSNAAQRRFWFQQRLRRLFRLLTHVARAAFVPTVLFIFAFDFFTFDEPRRPTERELQDVVAGVVFTGAFERVDEGLRLLAMGTIPRLYVSGVNAGAGINPKTFVQQFAIRTYGLDRIRPLASCCVEWGEKANNTLENAFDTKCWVERRGITEPILLVTSRRHMRRAFVALTGALPGHVIIPYPVDDALTSDDDGKARVWEYVKSLGTAIFFRVPRFATLEKYKGPFAKGCPEKL